MAKARSIDLLFAASGIEPEIAKAAESIEVAPNVIAPVARTGHLIVMKLVSQHATRRPQDRQDLVQLAKVANRTEWARAAKGIELVKARGFARRRDLTKALARLQQPSTSR